MTKKIALVKQNVYQDLYCCDSHQSPKNTILSSLRRCGPVALITECNADFHILNQADYAECYTWQEKSSNCGQRPVSYYQELAEIKHKELPYTKGNSQLELSKNIEDIDWSIYDIVISLDISIPKTTVLKFPKTLWCYMPGEPCMNIYKKSQYKIKFGYNVFLNQEIPMDTFTYREILHIPFYKSISLPIYSPLKKWRPKKQKEIDFPYTLTKHNSIEQLFENSGKTGIGFEFYTHQTLNKSDLMLFNGQKIQQNVVHHNIAIRLESLSRTKYFITNSNNYRRGNGLLEAMASGCLCLATKHQYLPNYQRLLGKLGKFNSNKEIIEFVKTLDNDDSLYQQYKSKQDILIDKHCFQIPIDRLFALHDHINK